MLFGFGKKKPTPEEEKKKHEEIGSKLSKIKKETKMEETTEDVEELVSGIAKGDSG